MTILFGGGEMGSFVPSDSGAVETASTSLFDTSFARCALQAAGSTTYNESTSWGSETDFWVHLELNAGNTVGSGSGVVVVNTSGTEVLRLLVSPNGSTLDTYQMQWNNSSVWTNIGSAVDVSANTRQTIDLHFFISASGTATMYLSGTQRATGTANLSALTDADKIRVYGTSAGQAMFSSQLVVADESTIGFRLKTAPPTGAGASTAWVGTFAEVDEIVYSDTDFVNSASAAEVELFTHSITVPDGYRVKAVIVSARAKRGTGGPQNLQLALRSGGTTYFGSTQALDAGYGAFVEVWEDDPATSAAFTASAITALQFGVKSIA